MTAVIVPSGRQPATSTYAQAVVGGQPQPGASRSGGTDTASTTRARTASASRACRCTRSAAARPVTPEVSSGPAGPTPPPGEIRSPHPGNRRGAPVTIR